MHPDVAPLAFLLGTWRGEGRGRYPTIEPFAYRQEIVVEHVADPSLLYLQSSWALADGAPHELDMGTERTPSVLHTVSRLRRDR